MYNNEGGQGLYIWCRYCKESFVGPSIIEDVYDQEKRI